VKDAIVEVPHPELEGQTIRRFADSGIQSSIEKAAAQLEPGKKLAVIIYGNLQDEARFAAVARPDSHLSIVGVLEHRPGPGAWTGEAGIVWSM
jgi:hypothetical protein